MRHFVSWDTFFENTPLSMIHNQVFLQIILRNPSPLFLSPLYTHAHQQYSVLDKASVFYNWK